VRRSNGMDVSGIRLRRDRWRRRHLGLIQALIPDDLEDRVREHVHRKGDLSKIIREALELWLKEKGNEI